MEKLESPADYILRIRGGPDYDHLTTLQVNDESRPLYINSRDFTGYLLMRLNDFNGVNREMETPDGIPKDGTKHAPIQNPTSSYFNGRNRRYSMVIQGRYKGSFNGDQVVFGIDSSLPLAPIYGIGVGLRICKWLDPTLEAELSGNEPHMYAPVVSGINALAVYNAARDQVVGIPMSQEEKESSSEYLPMSPVSPRQMSSTSSTADEASESLEVEMRRVSMVNPKSVTSPISPPRAAIEEESDYFIDVGDSEPLEIQKWAFANANVADESRLLFKDAKAQKACQPFRSRKSYLGKVDRRESITIDSQNIYCVDFYDCYFDHQNFNLNLPGFSMNAFSYWDGEQPLRYVCKSRDGSKVFWCFQFEWIPRSQYPGLV
ncbi:hypothetical protein HDU91_006614 [Kappamyces sp. JEL0680]|nr:hypothetical protein HDU91_006614 [Kappamyces sp. JEL0680]